MSEQNHELKDCEYLGLPFDEKYNLQMYKSLEDCLTWTTPLARRMRSLSFASLLRPASNSSSKLEKKY